LLVGAGGGAEIAGVDDHAVRLARQASPLVQETSLRAEIARSLALAQIRRGRPLDAAPLLIDAAREISSSDPAMALDLLLDATHAATDGAAFSAHTELSTIPANNQHPHD